MSVFEQLDDIDPVLLREECLVRGDAESVSLLILYLVKNDMDITFATNYLPHYLFQVALNYLRRQKGHGVDDLCEKAIRILTPISAQTRVKTDTERKQYAERMSQLRLPLTHPKFDIDIVGCRDNVQSGQALLDSGSDVCIMPFVRAQQCGLLDRINMVKGHITQGVNYETKSVGKISSLHIQIMDSVSGEKRHFYVDVIVQQTSFDCFILLGQTFIQQYGCVIESRRPEDVYDGIIHKVTIAVSSLSPTDRTGPSCVLHLKRI